MSQYLYFKKNDSVVFGIVRSSSFFYEAFNNYSENWEILTKRQIKTTIDNLAEKLNSLEKEINSYKEIFNQCIKLEDLIDVQETLNNLNDEKNLVCQAQGFAYVLEELLSECLDTDKIYWIIS